MIDYNHKMFKALVNDSDGQVSEQTTFHYRQKDNVLWGSYEGGMIAKGTITGRVLKDGKLQYHYQHITINDEIRTGYCEATPEVQYNGKIRLFEKWKWTDGKGKDGTSIVEEVLLKV